MNRVLRRVTDFRLITLAVASALAIAAANADARAGEARVNAKQAGSTSVSAAVEPMVQSTRHEPTAKAV